VDELLKKMADREQSIKTMQADTAFITQVGDGNPMNATGRVTTANVEVAGKLVLKKCQTTRTTMKTDTGNVVTDIQTVNDGEFLWMEVRTPGGLRLSVTKMKSEGGNVDEIKRRFDVKTVGEDTIGASKMYVLEGKMRPAPAGMRDDSGSVSKVKCFVDQQTLIVMRVTMYGLDGKEFYRFEMANVKLNEKVDMKMFEYTPPEGVEVNDLTKQPAAAEEK